VAGNLVPDHSTIADFRCRHERALSEVFSGVLGLCAQVGLTSVGVVSIDGTKMSANASMNANRDYVQIARAILREAAEIDQREDELYGDARGDELREQLRTREGRRQALREARNRELRGLQGRHFQRAGWVWISADIAKGGRQRWIPVLPELEPIAREIRETVAVDEYVLPAQRWRDPGANSRRGDLSQRPSSSQALRTAVIELAVRAGIHAHVHPHLMRHAFGDHIARYAGIKNAQALLGHADVGTTQVYTGAPTLDQLAARSRAFVSRWNPNGRSTPWKRTLQTR
jgi:integrase